ncbi:hypothetical protein CASFOL_015871 [Castilleja foliolosa]|uniref:dUTPase-like domain-containing protein n=1 Tax=Castilleja foliolosa TaxID=1961234 RepID=A0ABD3DEZ6_9LAMI
MQLDQLVRNTSLGDNNNSSIQPFKLDVLGEAFHIRESTSVDLPPVDLPPDLICSLWSQGRQTLTGAPLLDKDFAGTRSLKLGNPFLLVSSRSILIPLFDSGDAMVGLVVRNHNGLIPQVNVLERAQIEVYKQKFTNIHRELIPIRSLNIHTRIRTEVHTHQHREFEVYKQKSYEIEHTIKKIYFLLIFLFLTIPLSSSLSYPPSSPESCSF